MSPSSPIMSDASASVVAVMASIGPRARSGDYTPDPGASGRAARGRRKASGLPPAEEGEGGGRPGRPAVPAPFGPA